MHRSFRDSAKLAVRWIRLPAIALVLLAMGTSPPVGAAADPNPLAESERLLYAGDPIQAATVAESYLKSNPDSVDGRVALAQAKMAVGDFDTAYGQLRQAVRKDPKNVDALYHFAKLCKILAQREHERLFQMAPDHYRVHQLMGDAYLAQQNVEQAEEAYLRALEANPKSVAVLNALGDLKRRELGGPATTSLDSPKASRYEEAIHYYSRAAKLDASNYEAHYGLGVAYLNSGNNPEAVAHFRKAVQADPRSAVAHLGLGRALLSNGQPAEAVDELNTAVQQEPRLRQGFFLLSRAYQKLGKTDLAKEAMAQERELRQAEFRAAQDALAPGGVGASAGEPDN